MNGQNNLNEYKITMTNRKNIVIQGVSNVESFDDEEILLDTKMGPLVLKGQQLHIVQFNLDEGTLVVEGHFNSLDFNDENSARGLKGKGKGFLERILK